MYADRVCRATHLDENSGAQMTEEFVRRHQHRAAACRGENARTVHSSELESPVTAVAARAIHSGRGGGCCRHPGRSMALNAPPALEQRLRGGWSEGVVMGAERSHRRERTVSGQPDQTAGWGQGLLRHAMYTLLWQADLHDVDDAEELRPVDLGNLGFVGPRVGATLARRRSGRG